MRYRRDVPRDLDQETFSKCIQHMCAHLTMAVDPNDNPNSQDVGSVNVEVSDHFDGDESLVSILAEIDGEPTAHYLRDDFDPTSDHPEIKFQPFEQLDLGRVADHEALAQYRAEAL